MRAQICALLAVACCGSANAGEFHEVERYEAGDFATRAYWRMDFGGSAASAQGVGLRFDSERGYAIGAPATVHLQFGDGSVQALSVNGVDLRQNLAAAQNEGGFFSFFTSMTTPQLVAVGVAFTATTAIAVSAARDDDDEPEATGASSP